MFTKQKLPNIHTNPVKFPSVSLTNPFASGSKFCNSYVSRFQSYFLRVFYVNIQFINTNYKYGLFGNPNIPVNAQMRNQLPVEKKRKQEKGARD